MKALLRRRRPKKPHRNKRFTPARLILAATAFAATELVLGLAAGFLQGGRAEPLIFLAFRPWLLLLASALIGAYPLRQRAALIGSGLVLASLSEWMLIVALGAEHPWWLTLRGLAAGLLLAGALDFVFTQGRDFFGRGSALGMSLPLVAIFLYPGGLRGYESLALGAERPVAQGPDLMVMTGLPIIWGEGGAFDPASRPAASYAMLQRQFQVRPLDLVDPAALASGRLLLLAQPRALAPEELVAADAWVRGGGRLLLLHDPVLRWPTRLPLGDIRRPSPIGLLGPLLVHWGLEVERPADPAIVTADLDMGGARRRLLLDAPGRLVTHSPACSVKQPWLARCRIGQGDAVILVDADLLRDELWVGPGPGGMARNHRLSDNVVVVADLLDELAGIDRRIQRGLVDWIVPSTGMMTALLAALLPLLLSTVLAALFRRRA